MLVIGGGVIGLEMGSVWSRLGTEVTVIEFLDKITPSLDGEICNKFLQSLKKQGLKFELNTKVVSGKVENGRAIITTEPSKGGEKKVYDVDSVLVAIGRRPFTQNLGLKELGIEMDKQGRVVTNENFRTNIPNIYAIGDVNFKYNQNR
jgi:dihydrolipoamide dehydrogenase